MSKAKQAKQSQILEAVTPEIAENQKGKESNFKVKDSHFDKGKTFIDPKSKESKTIPVDFRKIHLTVPLVVFKDVPITEKQLAYFNDEAKAYWLEELNTKKQKKADEAAAKLAADEAAARLAASQS